MSLRRRILRLHSDGETYVWIAQSLGMNAAYVAYLGRRAECEIRTLIDPKYKGGYMR